ncbi:hypothetical protein GTY86_33740 [Streptomyces sp. SID5770]|uniref:type IV secretory system conjugative DNA transfer family protein n=1 Tax=Streptomyces sp. SID5770 TaxID=2690308 RepID=UPI001368919D|nr:hypothetical protein [Streptomyces sp. SID5770]MZE56148.1 hypothetical protein [Streptomyces sp. SID5770]
MSHDGLFNARFDAIVRDLADTEDDTETPETVALVPAAPTLPPSPLDEQDPVTPLAPLPPLTGVVHPGGGTAAETKRSAASRARSWIVSRTGIQTAAVTLGAPSAVWVLTEVSAAQATGWTGLGSGVLIVGGGALGVWSLSKNLGDAVTVTGLGAATVGLQAALAVAPSAWAGFIGWTLGGLGAGAARVAYANGRKKPEAEVRILAAEAQRREAAVLTEQFKAQAMLHRAQLEQLKVHAALTAATAPEAEKGPYLDGATHEERELRRAFWTAFKAELRACPVTPTLTGWIADIGLPADLARNAARQGWDKVATALGLPGRFALEDGASTNMLRAKFIDETRPRPDATWSPERISHDPRRASLGIDTETGEDVFIDSDERLLVCGASGTGKSWSTRPLMAHWHTYGWLVLIDGKGEEGNVWDSVCTVAREAEEIYAVIDSAHALMTSRKAEMRERGISVWDGEQVTVVVDEGQVVLALPGLKDGKEGAERLQRFIELSSLGRSRGVSLKWATQKPVMSGSSPGVHNLIAPNLLQRFSLRVADTQEAQTALDDCAYYNPQKVPAGDEWKGHGYLKGYGPSLIRTWKMTDTDVKALPAKHWAPAAGLVPSAAEELGENREEGLTENQQAVLAAIRAGHAGPSDIERATGINKGSVKRAMDRLEDLELI